MKRLILLFIILYTSVFATNLDYLLEEYETINQKSLQTVDEKLGHVFIYSQKDIKLMQYHKLNDILKELPLLNLNKNRYGLSSLSLAGTKTTVSGFFRVFINDHEVSSIYNQSAAVSWGELPLDFIDYVEIYYGESSFAFGNETGIYFIRLYTKKGVKENGNEINLKGSSKGSSSESFTNSRTFENGWSYLFYGNNQKVKETRTYKSNKLLNNSTRRYLYLDLSNENTDINMAYSDLKKDIYMGMSHDALPDDGEMITKDFFVDVTKYFLDDKSLKTNISYDVNNLDNKEINQEGMSFFPIRGVKEVDKDLKFTKVKASVTKTFEYKDNNFLAGVSASEKKYTKGKNTNSDFDKETINSLVFQDDYKLTDNLILIGNAKFDTYKRAGFLEDFSEELYRIGAIYTPFENFGLKTFYTKTYLPPSFFDIEFAFLDKNLDIQKYKFYTVEAVYTTQNSKIGVIYHDVKIDDFIYLEPTIGFMNIDHTIETTGYIFSYEYLFEDANKIQLNYYTTTLSETLNNSSKGGYLKYMGEYGKFEYFTSVIYKNAYSYKDIKVDASYDLSLGVAYNINKNLKVSLKGENLLDNSTESLYSDSGKDFAFDDYERSATLSLKWIF